jgi:hypothetical protein
MASIRGFSHRTLDQRGGFVRACDFMSHEPTLATPAVLRLAAETPCDPRTALRFLRGERVRGERLRARLTDAQRRLTTDERAA